MGTIYRITNIVNGKAYIGQTTQDNIRKRINSHFYGWGSPLIKQAVTKYGRDAFTFELLHENVLDQTLNLLEKYEIKKHDTLAPNGYNLESGGNKNKSISEATRQRLRDANKGTSNPNHGKEYSTERRKQISITLKGNKHLQGHIHSPETRKKMSDAKKGENNNMFGKTHSSEARQKMSDARKRYWAEKKKLPTE